MLSIFKQCKQCSGPSYLKCAWLNKKYFGNGEAGIVLDDLSSAGAFVINNIDKNHARRLQGIEKNMVFELEGTICALLNGKIALHQSGDFIKTCPAASHSRDVSLPTSLKIINSGTKEVLATYSMVTEHWKP